MTRSCDPARSGARFVRRSRPRPGGLGLTDMAEHVTYLFTDTGGILLLDPANAPALAPACMLALNTALDPEGRTDASSGRSAAEWSDEWSAAVTQLRERSAGGLFVLLLSGEGTFHIGIRNPPARYPAEPTGMPVELVTVTSGELALTDGMPLFEGDTSLSRDRVYCWPMPNGTYAVHVEYPGNPPGEPPIVGEYGSPTHPAIALSLLPVSGGPARRVAEGPFPRLPSSLAGCPSHHPGWRSWALVKTLSGPSAGLSLTLTDSVQSGEAHAAVPPDIPLTVGDFVLVELLARAVPSWEARILRKAP